MNYDYILTIVPKNGVVNEQTLKDQSVTQLQAVLNKAKCPTSNLITTFKSGKTGFTITTVPHEFLEDIVYEDCLQINATLEDITTSIICKKDDSVQHVIELVLQSFHRINVFLAPRQVYATYKGDVLDIQTDLSDLTSETSIDFILFRQGDPLTSLDSFESSNNEITSEMLDQLFLCISQGCFPQLIDLSIHDCLSMNNEKMSLALAIRSGYLQKLKVLSFQGCEMGTVLLPFCNPKSSYLFNELEVLNLNGNNINDSLFLSLLKSFVNIVPNIHIMCFGDNHINGAVIKDSISIFRRNYHYLNLIGLFGNEIDVSILDLLYHCLNTRLYSQANIVIQRPYSNDPFISPLGTGSFYIPKRTITEDSSSTNTIDEIHITDSFHTSHRYTPLESVTDLIDNTPQCNSSVSTDSSTINSVSFSSSSDSPAAPFLPIKQLPNKNDEPTILSTPFPPYVPIDNTTSVNINYNNNNNNSNNNISDNNNSNNNNNNNISNNNNNISNNNNNTISNINNTISNNDNNTNANASTNKKYTNKYISNSMLNMSTDSSKDEPISELPNLNKLKNNYFSSLASSSSLDLQMNKSIRDTFKDEEFGKQTTFSNYILSTSSLRLSQMNASSLLKNINMSLNTSRMNLPTLESVPPPSNENHKMDMTQPEYHKYLQHLKKGTFANQTQLLFCGPCDCQTVIPAIIEAIQTDKLSKLIYLGFQDMKISGSLFKTLCQTIKTKLPNVETLLFNNCNLDYIQHLFSFLRLFDDSSFNHLKVLSLQGNPFGIKGLKGIYNFLITTTFLPALDSIKLQNTTIPRVPKNDHEKKQYEQEIESMDKLYLDIDDALLVRTISINDFYSTQMNTNSPCINTFQNPGENDLFALNNEIQQMSPNPKFYTPPTSGSFPRTTLDTSSINIPDNTVNTTTTNSLSPSIPIDYSLPNNQENQFIYANTNNNNSINQNLPQNSISNSNNSSLPSGNYIPYVNTISTTPIPTAIPSNSYYNNTSSTYPLYGANTNNLNGIPNSINNNNNNINNYNTFNNNNGYNNSSSYLNNNGIPTVNVSLNAINNNTNNGYNSNFLYNSASSLNSMNSINSDTNKNLPSNDGIHYPPNSTNNNINQNSNIHNSNSSYSPDPSSIPTGNVSVSSSAFSYLSQSTSSLYSKVPTYIYQTATFSSTKHPVLSTGNLYRSQLITPLEDKQLGQYTNNFTKFCSLGVNVFHRVMSDKITPVDPPAGEPQPTVLNLTSSSQAKNIFSSINKRNYTSSVSIACQGPTSIDFYTQFADICSKQMILNIQFLSFRELDMPQTSVCPQFFADLGMLPNLSTLEFFKCNIGDQGFIKFCECLSDELFINLQGLYISCDHLSSKSLTTFYNILNSTAISYKLHSFDISGNISDIQGDDVNSIYNDLHGLVLKRTQLLLSNDPSLSSRVPPLFSSSGNTIPENFECVPLEINIHWTIKDMVGLDLLYKKAQITVTPIETFDISNCYITQEGIPLLLTILRLPIFRTVKLLDVSNNRLTSQSFGQLISGIRGVLVNLNTLNISNNPIDDSGLVIMTTLLSTNNFIPINKLIANDIKISTQGFSKFIDIFLQYNTTITSISFCGNHLKFSALKQFCSCFKKHLDEGSFCLEEVMLTQGKTTEDEIDQLIKILSTINESDHNLLYLKLSSDKNLQNKVVNWLNGTL
ncbi:hypothetical protein WA158_002136 [Blastocystis sp. Blastoise]